MYFYNSQGGISRLEAVILIVLFCAFIGYTIYMGRKESKKEQRAGSVVLQRAASLSVQFRIYAELFAGKSDVDSDGWRIAF